MSKNDKRFNLLLWGTLIWLGVSSFIFFVAIPSDQRTWVNGTSILGSTGSIVGLIIAIYQLQDLELKTLRRVNHNYGISNASSSTILITMIQGYLNKRNFEMALLRMKELTAIINTFELNHTEIVESYGDQYRNSILGLNTDIISLNQIVTNEIREEEIKVSNIVSNLDQVSLYISRLSIQLKMQL